VIAARIVSPLVAECHAYDNDESGRRDPGWCHLPLSLHTPDVAPYWSMKLSVLG
jgi:hypothetical protein